MKYKGFEIKISHAEIIRQGKNGEPIVCEGFRIEIFRRDCAEKLDEFTAAVGFELLENSLAEAQQLAMDYLGCEKQNYLK